MHQIMPPARNLDTLAKGNAKMGTIMAEMALAAFQIRSERQYVELGHGTISKFLDSLGSFMSPSTFHQYANIGACMENCKIEKLSIAELGFCKAHMLSRLGKSSDDAEILADDIRKLVIDGPKMTVAVFGESVDRILNGGGAADGAADGDDKPEPADAQLKRLRKIASTANTVEEVFKIIAADKKFGPMLRTFMIQ